MSIDIYIYIYTHICLYFYLYLHAAMSIFLYHDFLSRYLGLEGVEGRSFVGLGSRDLGFRYVSSGYFPGDGQKSRPTPEPKPKSRKGLGFRHV